MDPFHSDLDPDPFPMITDPDPDPGRILTKIQIFEISKLFLREKNFVNFLCLSKNVLNTQILEHLEISRGSSGPLKT